MLDESFCDICKVIQTLHRMTLIAHWYHNMCNININQSQGQSLGHVDVYLPTPVEIGA